MRFAPWAIHITGDDTPEVPRPFRLWTEQGLVFCVNTEPKEENEVMFSKITDFQNVMYYNPHRQEHQGLPVYEGLHPNPTIEARCKLVRVPIEDAWETQLTELTTQLVGQWSEPVWIVVYQRSTVWRSACRDTGVDVPRTCYIPSFSPVESKHQARSLALSFFQHIGEARYKELKARHVSVR